MEELLWTFQETRKRLKKSEYGLRWLVRTRDIPIVKIGNRIYFRPEEILKWIEQKSIPAMRRK